MRNCLFSRTRNLLVVEGISAAEADQVRKVCAVTPLDALLWGVDKIMEASDADTTESEESGPIMAVAGQGEKTYPEGCKGDCRAISEISWI